MHQNQKVLAENKETENAVKGAKSEKLNLKEENKQQISKGENQKNQFQKIMQIDKVNILCSRIFELLNLNSRLSD